MHLGRWCARGRSQSVGPETARENLSLEIEAASGSVSLTNPRSKRHGYLLSCLEKKLNGQVQPESACVQSAVRNLPGLLLPRHTFAPSFFLPSLSSPLSAASGLIVDVSSGESPPFLFTFALPTNHSLPTTILTPGTPLTGSFLSLSLLRFILSTSVRVLAISMPFNL